MLYNLVNGIDFVISLPGKEKGEIYYIGVDVTSSDNLLVLEKKLNKLTDKLKNNTLPEVKYFVDDENPEIKKKIFLPKVVISTTNGKAKAIQEGLSKDRNYMLEADVRKEFIDEIEQQLVKSSVYLLERFYGPSASDIRQPKDLLSYFENHKIKIEKTNKSLFENVLKHVKILEFFQELE